MVVDQDCDRSKITDLVTSIVPGSDLSRSHSKELAFRLPLKSVDNFPGKHALLAKSINNAIKTKLMCNNLLLQAYPIDIE